MPNARRDMWGECVPPNLFTQNTAQILLDITFTAQSLVNSMNGEQDKIQTSN